MHSSSGLVALAALLSTASAATFGFNYGAQFADDSAKVESDFAAEFEAAKKLPGVNGAFTSARLYTMIQHGTTNDIIQAIPAAIESNTHLLLGLWASGDPAGFKNELSTLQAALQKYPKMADLVDGISVGSEDLYRTSDIGLKAPDAAPGNTPDVISNYIGQVRSAIKGTALSKAPVGHVDTWTAWANSSNSAVAKVSDFIGTDAYPYFQDTMDNSIENAEGLFEKALAETRKFTGNTPIWITETGWAVSGPTKNLAKADISDAKKYWDAVGCKLLAGDMNTWWYTLYDSGKKTPSPSFGIVGDLGSKPLFDLSCKDVDTSKTSTASESSSKTASGSGSSETTDSGSPGVSASNSADASATATGGSYATGSAPIATGTGSAGTGNSTTFIASATPSAPVGGAGGSGSGSGATGSGAAGSPSASSTAIAASAGYVNSASIVGLVGGFALAALLI